MDFKISNPLHIFAGLLVGLTVVLLVVSPIFSFIGYFPTSEDIVLTETLILFSALTAIILLVGSPLLWYAFVNSFSPPKILEHLKIDFKSISQAVFWAIIAIALMYSILIGVGIVLTLTGYASNEITNVEEIASNLSIGSIIFITVFQSSSEEIFFRGFLFDKLEKESSQYAALMITATLFGIAHLSYGKIYPAVMTLVFGLILGWVVLKSKNLLSAIFAHILYNGLSFALFFIVQTYNVQAIMI